MGCTVGTRDVDTWVRHLAKRATANGAHHHLSMNASKWLLGAEQSDLRHAFRAAHSIAVDGVGLQLAAWWAGLPVPRRAPGIDVADGLVHHAIAQDWRVALMGAEPDVNQRLRELIGAKGGHVVFSRHGRLDDVDEATLCKKIASQRPSLILVALGSPKAERFIATLLPLLDSGLVMGVGGAFDVWTGKATRAPAIFRRCGLEWFWRWCTAPRQRWRRAIVRTLAFLFAILQRRQWPNDA